MLNGFIERIATLMFSYQHVSCLVMHKYVSMYIEILSFYHIPYFSQGNFNFNFNRHYNAIMDLITTLGTKKVIMVLRKPNIRKISLGHQFVIKLSGKPKLD